MDKNFEYCVVIRTLGMAGEKFRRELESLHNQTVKPKRILVYLAEGYSRPDFIVGMETYITVPKGLIAQRALPYTEVDTPYMLMLDDDVFFPEGGVERLYNGLVQEHGDCIAVDAFHPHHSTWTQVLYNYLTNMVYSRPDDGWAFKVCGNGSFSYNRHPHVEVCPTESAAGTCLLWKTEVFRSIHFEDEMWLDRSGYAFGEDFLMTHKVVRNGYRLLIDYNSGIQHLDAKSARSDRHLAVERLCKRSKCQFLQWFRVCYDASDLSLAQRKQNERAWHRRVVQAYIVHLLYALFTLNPQVLRMFLKGLKDGQAFVQSDIYKSAHNYIVK